MISGVEHRIPRRLINELVNIPARVLAKELRVGVGGDVISVPSHDVDSALAVYFAISTERTSSASAGAYEVQQRR